MEILYPCTYFSPMYVVCALSDVFAILIGTNHCVLCLIVRLVHIFSAVQVPLHNTNVLCVVDTCTVHRNCIL